MYRGLLFKFENRVGGDPEHPNSGCMAVARNVFCAFQFKRCHSYVYPKQPICNWMCDLFKNRCEDEIDLIDEICNDRDEEASASHTCSKATRGVEIYSKGVILILLGVYLFNFI